MKHMTFGWGGDKFVVQDQIQAFNNNPEAVTKQPSDAQIREAYASIETGLKDASNNGLHGIFREWMVGLQTYNPNLARSLLKAEVLQTLKLQATEQATAGVTALAKDVTFNRAESKDMSRKILELRQLFEKSVREPLDAINMAYILKELPENDPIARSFVMRGLIGKLRADGYSVAIGVNNIILVKPLDPRNTSLASNFEDLLNTRAQKSDIEEALIIGSGSLTQFQTGYKGDITKVTNKEYIEYIMAEYCLKPSVTIAEIQSNQSMTPEKKALLISALSNGIITDAPLYPTLTHYNATKKDTQEFFSSPGYLQAEKMVIQVTGEKTSTQADTELLVQKISEDPVSALSGKPITTIAAGIAIIIGLGYEGKGKGFSFWTGLKRGFIGIIALFLGNAVAKEWGMDPKKLLKEGVDMVKDGGKKAGDAAVGLTSGAPGVVDGAAQSLEKKEENKEEKLTTSQQALHDKLLANPDIKNKVNAFATEEKKKGSAGKTGTLEHYAEFISSPKFQELKPEYLFFNENHADSVFSLNPSLSSHVSLPSNLDPMVFKRVMRAYLTTKDSATKGSKGDQDAGAPEKEAFLQSNGITADKMKDKTMKDIASIVHEKMSKPSPATATPTSAPSLVQTATFSIDNMPSGLVVTPELSSDKQSVTIKFDQEVINNSEKTKQLTLKNTNNSTLVRFNGTDYTMTLNGAKITFTKK